MIPTRSRRAVRWLTAATLILATTADARAFFFKGWPGDGLLRTPTLLGPRPNPGDHDDQPPGFEPSSGFGSLIPPGGESPVLPAVPEPGTVVLAAVGLGALALARRRASRRTR